MEKANIDLVKELVQETVLKMGFSCEVEAQGEFSGEETLVFNIKTQDSSFLIGQYGANLQSLQHIIRILAREKIKERSRFVLDVNSYRKEKNDSVLRLAKELSEQVLREKRAIIMRPMSPYERRLVHLELAKNEQIKTESIGEGEERKIVIKPVNLF